MEQKPKVYLLCERCNEPINYSEGIPESDKEDFKGEFELEELICEKCAPQPELTAEEEAQQIEEFMEELYDELYNTEDHYDSDEETDQQ